MNLVEVGDNRYGSDQHGIVWAYRFDVGQPALEIDAAAAIDWIKNDINTAPSSFLWLHLTLSNTAAERWMRGNLALPELFYQSLHESAVSTRVEQDDAALVAVLHDVLFDATFDASSVSSVSLCLESRLLVSARIRPLRSVDRLRATVKSGQRFRSSTELLAQLLRVQAGVLVDIVRQSTARVDGIEDKLLANRVTTSRRELGSLRRLLVRLQRLLAPEPAALFRLLSKPPSWVADADLQDLRQSAEEFSASVADSASLAERVRLLQEEFAALTSEQTSRTLFVLTVVTVLALPINMVAGLFGMNVGGIPLAEYGHGFLVIVILLTAITAILGYLAFGRRND